MDEELAAVTHGRADFDFRLLFFFGLGRLAGAGTDAKRRSRIRRRISLVGWDIGFFGVLVRQAQRSPEWIGPARQAEPEPKELQISDRACEH